MKRLQVIMSGALATLIGASLLMTARYSRAQSEPTRTSESLTPEQRTRRVQAVQLARAINTAEARARMFIPLDGLTDIVIPDGFALQLVGDSIQQMDRRSNYIFTIKDTRDVCKPALFSDQNGLIYVAEPLR